MAQSLRHSSSRLADIRSSACLGSSSYYQSDLQLVLFDNLILLCHKFGHIPGAVDVPPSEPVALLLRQVDDSIGRKLGGLGKNFGASAHVSFYSKACYTAADILCFRTSGTPPGPKMSVPGMFPGWIQNARTPFSPYSETTNSVKRRRASFYVW